MKSKNKNKLVAIIPLRKGSKGIPEKNIRLFNGKPLFTWILETVIRSDKFDSIWIATDDPKVVDLIDKSYNEIIYIYNRSDESSTDFSPTSQVVLEFINHHNFKDDDRIILFQATSPFTSIEDIEKVIEELSNDNFDSIVTCYRIKKFRWDCEGNSLDYDLNSKPRRQDYPGFLIESGAIYASKIKSIKSSGVLISGKISVVEINSNCKIDIEITKIGL